MIAFTSVIAATPAFEGFTGWLAQTSFSPYFQAVIAANLIGIVNGSAGAIAQFVGQTFGQTWLAAGVNADGANTNRMYVAQAVVES